MIRLASTAALVFSLLAPAAYADWFGVSVRTEANIPVVGATVCPVVLEAPRAALPATGLINGARQITNQEGFASFSEPEERWTNLFFEGRIRFLVFADGYCPAACDVDFYWSHQNSMPRSVPEDYRCSLNMQWAEPGGYSCRVGRTNTANLMNLSNSFIDENGEYTVIADIDGEILTHYGETRVGMDRCPRRQVQVPAIPEIVPQNPALPRPTPPGTPVDPNVIQPQLPRL